MDKYEKIARSAATTVSCNAGEPAEPEITCSEVCIAVAETAKKCTRSFQSALRRFISRKKSSLTNAVDCKMCPGCWFRMCRCAI
jgi:hypothetical protein